MITLKLTNYTETEKKLLWELLSNAVLSLPCDKKCKGCPYSRICSDLGYASCYAAKAAGME